MKLPAIGALRLVAIGDVRVETTIVDAMVVFERH